jgi:hypothetical protein
MFQKSWHLALACPHPPYKHVIDLLKTVVAVPLEAVAGLLKLTALFGEV